MRTTGYSNDKLCHMFATLGEYDNMRAAGEIRSSSMLMKGNTIYSYGLHYPLAVLDWENDTALVRHHGSARDRSRSTGQHQQLVVANLTENGWLVIQVPFLDNGNKVNLECLQEEIEHAREKYARARKEETRLYWRMVEEENRHWYEMLNSYYVVSGREVPTPDH